MTRADFLPVLERMRSEVERARKVVERVGAADQRAAALYGLSVSERAIKSWETTQLDEVLAGTRPLARWTAYGQDLAYGLELIIRDAGAFSAQFSGLANWLGDSANAILGPLEAQVAELRSRVDDLRKQQVSIEAARKELKDQPITDEARKVLFGLEASGAASNMATLGNLLVGLETGVSLLRSGKAKLTRSADGKDVQITPLSGVAQMALGAVPLVAAAVTIGTVATALAIAVSVKAYFGHADAIARTERTRLALDAAKASGKDPVKVLEQLNKGDEIAAAGGFGDVLGTVRFFAGLAAAGGAAWGGWKLWEHYRGTARR